MGRSYARDRRGRFASKGGGYGAPNKAGQRKQGPKRPTPKQQMMAEYVYRQKHPGTPFLWGKDTGKASMKPHGSGKASSTRTWKAGGRGASSFEVGAPVRASKGGRRSSIVQARRVSRTQFNVMQQLQDRNYSAKRRSQLERTYSRLESRGNRLGLRLMSMRERGSR